VLNKKGALLAGTSEADFLFSIKDLFFNWIAVAKLNLFLFF